MRILWVKAGKLLPVDTGGKIRSFNILRELAATNAVTFLVSALFLLRIPGRALEAPAGPRRGHWRELAYESQEFQCSKGRFRGRPQFGHFLIGAAVID